MRQISPGVTSVPLPVRNESLVFRRSAYPHPLRRASRLKFPSDRLAPVTVSINGVRILAPDVVAWSAPFRPMPASVRNTSESRSRRARRRHRSPRTLSESGLSTYASLRRSDSSRLPQTTVGLREYRSPLADARWRWGNRSCVSILPEPMRKMWERNAGVRNLRMPFLLPFEGHETIVAQLAKRSSNLV